MTSKWLDIAMALIRHNVLDIRRQNGQAVQHISLPKPTAFLAYKENLSMMKQKLAALPRNAARPRGL
jgi:hypothetical protein